LCGADARITRANDEVHFGLDNNRRVVGKLIDAEPEAAIVDNEVFTIDEAIWSHRIKKGDIIRRVAGTKMQVTEAIGSSRLLCPSGNWPRRNRSPEQYDELAPSHAPSLTPRTTP
jgi:hypothetical protein